MQAMVLAAGFGVRLLPFTKIRPKPLFPVANRPLLLRTLDGLKKSGCSSLLVNAHHLGDQIQSAVSRYDPSIHVQYESTPLGTGGGLRKALPRLRDKPLLVVNGDICHTIDLRQVYRHHLDHGGLATLVLHRHRRFASVQLDADARIVAFHRGPRGATSDELLAFTGIQVINPEILSLVPENTFFDSITLYEQLIRQGGLVHGLEMQGHYWRDMGTAQDYLALHQDLLCGSSALRGAALQGGPSCATPFCVADNVRWRRAMFSHWVAVGENVVLGENTRLTRVVVWDDAVIEANSVYRDCILPGCSLR